MKRLLLALPLLVFVVIGLIAVVMLNASSRGERDSQAIGFSMTGSTVNQPPWRCPMKLLKPNFVG